MSLPAPIVMTDSYVVLTTAQWERVVVKDECVPVTTYTTVWEETYGRHVITVDTIGM